MNKLRVFLFLLLILLLLGLLYAAPFQAQKKARAFATQPARAGRDMEAAVRANNLGAAYMSQQRFPQALRQFERAAALDGELWVARLNQGIALYNAQRFDEARAILEEVTRAHPESVRAWYNLGLLLRQQGQSEAALAAFGRAAELDPEDADSQYFLGWMATQLEKYDDAIAAYRRALTLNPFHASAEFGLARALQRRGQTDEARQHLARFQHITQEKLGAPISLAYGDQGRYSLAEEVGGGRAAPRPAILVRFLPATRPPGLRFIHHGSTIEAAGEFGSGACFLDYDNDGRPDLVLLSSGGKSATALYRNLAPGRFVDATRTSGLVSNGDAVACTAGDYDNDGKTDLAVSFVAGVRLFRNLGGKFEEVTGKSGLETGAQAAHPEPRGVFMGVTFVDYDHDGDLDLYATRYFTEPVGDRATTKPVPQSGASMGNILWRNNGNGTFTERTEQTGLAGSGPSFGAVLSDMNSDRAVDLVVTGTGAAPTVYLNPREGMFRAERPWAQAMPGPTVGAVVLDFDKDGWMDLAFTHAQAPGLTLWRNLKGKTLEPVPLPELAWHRGWGLAAVDYDNDGWIDLVAAGESSTRSEVRLLRNKGTEGFEDVTRGTGLLDLKLAKPRAVLAADYDRDGDTDLLVTQNNGPVVLLRNDGGNRNGWLRLAFRGLNDNKSAVGTKVEVFAGTLWQKWEVGSASGYLGQSAPEILAGLGQERRADIVRMLWPTGVLQDEIQFAARRSVTVDEIDRRGSSCPVLFAWNGERYEFVTDMIGAGVLGHWVAPGEQNVPDPTEYLKVEGERIQLRNGRLSFRFVEPMEETVYLDQVRLLAVDHPADVEVYPNEQFRITPPFPDFQVIVSRDAHPPAAAHDDSGRDVLPRLLHRDQRYVDGFARQSFRGFAEMHSLELDLGEPYAGGPLRLIMTGYIDYFTPTSAYAANQAGVHAIVPYVEALDAGGRWVKAVEEMGFPAGLARTMTTDLSSKLPRGTRCIRIRTNLAIYWDQILIDRTRDEPAVHVSEVPLAGADLAYLGYPRLVEGRPRGNARFDYSQVSATGPYARHAGSFTRYGDVHELLTAAEDRFVMMGSGDEVALEFDPAGLPPLPSGWKRDYFFYADGFTKDMDFYAARAYSVGPLPFHGMGTYPYPPSLAYPSDATALEYLLNFNTRLDRGTTPSSLRFQYGERPPSSAGGRESGAEVSAGSERSRAGKSRT
ncbi:MAG TPA: FG-GAP-like repeat-containing protein [Terriglobales bacterium]|nr:FG-GAP-like repeat-containing protein [Terriglobales bacterium]